MSRRACMFSAALVAASLAIAAPAEAQTFSRTTHTGLFHPLAADLNGDGRMDIAGTTFPGTNAGVLINNGSGGFGPMATFPAGGDAMSIGGGDLNRDGHFDLVVTINQPDIALALLMGNGDGTFDAPVHLPNTAVADSPSVVVTDLDADGFQDIVVAHNASCYVAPCVNSSKMSVLMGNGDGTFLPSRDFDVGVGMADIAIGDFNRDGIKDLVVSASSARLYRLQGVGDGTFTQLETLTLDPSPSFIELTDVDVADFNRDGIEDLVTTLSTNSSRLAVLTGTGDGEFSAPLIMQEALDVPQHLAVADYNGDGFLDLAYGFANGNAGLFAIRNGNGNGTFQAPRRYEVPPNQSSIGTVGMLTAHFNADTKPDLALAIGGAFPAHWVLLNTTGVAPPPTPGTPTLISPAAGATVQLPFTFDWSDVANAVRYRIQIDDESNFATPLFDRETAASEFAAPTLNPRRHWWRVRAINSAGVAGAYSGSRRFTIGSAPPATLTAPTLLSPADGATVAQPLTLDWSDVTGAVNYRVQIDDSSTFSSPLTVDQTVFGSQFTAPTLPTRQHWWRVRGTNSAGTAGPFSAVRSFTPTALPPPAAPILRTPVDGATPANPIAFDWDAVSGAANYRIQIDNSSDFASPVVDTTNEASAFTAPTLAATQHWWRVLAINSAGTAGPFSTVWSLTPQGSAPPPPPPPGETATLTVTASGRGGERVLSSPAGINVAVGGSGSASFTTGTSLTMSVSNGRDAIWSGACSSNGQKTRTCRFTFNGASSISANVQ